MRKNNPTESRHKYFLWERLMRFFIACRVKAITPARLLSLSAFPVAIWNALFAIHGMKKVYWCPMMKVSGCYGYPDGWRTFSLDWWGFYRPFAPGGKVCLYRNEWNEPIAPKYWLGDLFSQARGEVGDYPYGWGEGRLRRSGHWSLRVASCWIFLSATLFM